MNLKQTVELKRVEAKESEVIWALDISGSPVTLTSVLWGSGGLVHSLSAALVHCQVCAFEIPCVYIIF